LLTGKYQQTTPEESRANAHAVNWVFRGTDEENAARVAKVGKLIALAESIGTSVTQLSLAWCLKNPNVSSVILGASKIHQLEENLKAIQVQALLTDDVMAEIETIMANKPVVERYI
jgi:aryl-alcohol dehydrogenase-like predicted oxidoreductase